MVYPTPWFSSKHTFPAALFYQQLVSPLWYFPHNPAFPSGHLNTGNLSLTKKLNHTQIQVSMVHRIVKISQFHLIKSGHQFTFYKFQNTNMSEEKFYSQSLQLISFWSIRIFYSHGKQLRFSDTTSNYWLRLARSGCNGCLSAYVLHDSPVSL